MPCESLTTIVVAPPARAPRIAAFTSSAIIFRERPYSAPAAESWSDAEMPLIPSMSAEMKTFLPGCVAAPAPSQATAATVARMSLAGLIMPGRIAQSPRSAWMTSTREARAAGSSDARIAAATSTPAAAAIGSAPGILTSVM